MTDDGDLLRQYACEGSETAFEELVRRHLSLVYSSALRQVGGDEAMAKDVAQTVFIDLARKARSLLDRELLAGWLYASTRLAVSNSVRAEIRRRNREGIAVSMQENVSMPPSDADRAELNQMLDEAMNQLETEDRNAVLLRFFQGKGLKEVGLALGISEDAARMRVNRSLDRLHLLLNQRGLAISATALGGILAAETVAAVPQGLAASISGMALANAAGAGTSLTLAKMVMISKLKLSILGALAVAGVATPLAIHHQSQLQLLQKEQSLRRQVEQLAELSADNERLSNQLAQVRGSLVLGNVDASELLRLRGEVGLLRRQLAGMAAKTQTTTNQIQFTLPYLPREAWSDRGTAKPLDTIQTMFWAMGQGDQKRLEQIVSRARDSQPLDELTVSKQDWDKITAVQIVDVATSRGSSPQGGMEDMATAEVIVEVPYQDGIKDVSMQRWSLKKFNDRWLITGRH
jgi:RNA polymerase sigma factor (sigma-70 family)